MKKYLLCGIIAPFILGCNANKPYVGETTTKVVDPSGMTVTTKESRSMLAGNVLSGSDYELRQISAKILSANPKTRELVIQTNDSKKRTIVAGDDVRNFSQIKPGDYVNVGYLVTINFEVRSPTPEEVAQADNTDILFARSEKGEKPNGLVGMGDLVILTIEAINKEAQTLTLRGPKGALTIKAAHPENLEFVKAGDTVVVRVSQVIAAKVAPVGA